MYVQLCMCVGGAVTGKVVGVWSLGSRGGIGEALRKLYVSTVSIPNNKYYNIPIIDLFIQLNYVCMHHFLNFSAYVIKFWGVHA